MFRFAALPCCLHDQNMMRKQYEMLRKAGILIICIFRSTPENISEFASESVGEGMLALSDRNGEVYKKYKVKNTLKAFIDGEVEVMGNWGKIYKRFFKRNILKDASMGGRVLRPADFLINEDGIIVDLYQAFEEPKQMSMPFDRIEAFIPEGKRCRCNTKNCISPNCRDNWKKDMSETAVSR